MKILPEYLKYLNEVNVAPVIKKAGEFTGSKFVSGMKDSVKFAGYTAAAIAAWRTANFIFSSASRKCGSFKKSTPGFKTCVSREKIKSFQQKIMILTRAMNNCNKSKNPEICKQKSDIEIKKLKSRIEIEQNKIKEVLGENTNLQEFLPAVAGLAVSFIGMAVVDKAIFLSWRSALGIFSKASRQCGTFKKGSERDLCMSKMKLKSLMQQLQIVNKVYSICDKQKDPQKCKQKGLEKIEELKKKIQIEHDNIIAYQNQITQEQREKQMKAAQREKI